VGAAKAEDLAFINRAPFEEEAAKRLRLKITKSGT